MKTETMTDESRFEVARLKVYTSEVEGRPREAYTIFE
jgi:hypothetical protein